MEFTVHMQVLTAAFAIAVVMGAVANKTNFCTMGAVSDWINIGDTGRMRAWVLAMAGVIVGSFIYAMATRSFRVERFASFKDFVNHAIGGALMSPS